MRACVCIVCTKMMQKRLSRKSRVGKKASAFASSMWQVASSFPPFFPDLVFDLVEISPARLLRVLAEAVRDRAKGK